jgi:hypothetical protein
MLETEWQPEEGDRVSGTTIEGNPDQGIITQMGAKYAILNNTSRRALTIASLTLLQAQAIPADLLHLVGLEWSEQVDKLFADRGISNLSNFIGTKPEPQFFESWRGWIVSFHKTTEVHLCKAGRQPHSWFLVLAKHPQLRSNGDISKFCREAIDAAEDATSQVAVGMGGQESAVSGQPGKSPDDFPNAVEVADSVNQTAIAPLTPLETLSAAIAALYADAEQAEATMLNAGKAALSLYLELGEKLIEAKGQVAHGQWLPWLEEQKIQERKAQRAIALFKGRAALEAKNDTLTDLTLTEALAIVSNRKLKTATPEEPQTENAPIPANSPPPEATAPDRVAEDVAPETEPLEGKNGAIVIDEYEYVEMSPRECWFDPGGGVVEGSAIAQNGKGFVRINWGEGRQSDVPGSRVSWSDPAITAVAAEIETGLAAIGLKVCRPSITPEEFNCEMWGDRPLLPNGLAEERPTGSQWLRRRLNGQHGFNCKGCSSTWSLAHW